MQIIPQPLEIDSSRGKLHCPNVDELCIHIENLKEKLVLFLDAIGAPSLEQS